MNTNYRLLVILIFLISSSCASSSIKFVTTSIDINHAPYSQENVVLLLTPDFCTPYHIDLSFVYELGPTLCANSEKLVKLIYSDVLVVKETATDKLENASLIIKPTLVNKLMTVQQVTIPIVFSTLLVMKWEITDSRGELISKKTIRAVGRDDRIFGMDMHARFQSSVQKAIDNLFIKSSQHLLSATELKEAIK